MTAPRWSPAEETTELEDILLARLERVRKLFGFLRRHRHELFDGDFQDELAEMYRDSGAGKPPVPPSLLAMASILQGYMGISDAEAVELTVVDVRWQLVLDCLGAREPLFSQGALHAFRERMIEHDMDQRLLQRTRELARECGEFDWKKLPKDLRIAVDSAPFEGAGRVEDAFNLLGHAARNVVTTFALLLEVPQRLVAEAAGAPLLNASSIKAALDVDWTHPTACSEALNQLVAQLDQLRDWGERQRLNGAKSVAVLSEVRAQNLEMIPEQPEVARIPRGVPKDRRISVEDGEMRHGRKSSTRTVDGYKRHIARELETDLIWACALSAANEPEAESLREIDDRIRTQNRLIGELYIDRGYLSSEVVDELVASGAEVICRPWSPRNRGELFTKMDFQIDLDHMKITCPNNEIVRIPQLGAKIEFPGTACDSCPLRQRCTTRKGGRGRTIRIAEDEPLQQHLRVYTETAEGRARHRERVTVEHGLAHICARQGNRARYLGKRKNLYDLRRAAAIQNLETTQRTLGEGYYREAA